MISKLFQTWWLFALRGVVAVVFGILALIWPAKAWIVLVVLFGIFVLLDGILTTMVGIDFYRYFDRWWAVLLQGVAGIVIGIMTLIWLRPASHVLFYWMAAWAVITGIFEIVSAARFRLFTSGEWALMLAGVLSILFGVLLIVYPGPGLIALVWVIGIFAIAYGIMELIFSSRLHKLGNAIKQTGLTGI